MAINKAPGTRQTRVWCLVALLGWACQAEAVPILDQTHSGTATFSQGIGGSPGSFGNPVVAQSFTVGIAGTLESVDVFIMRSSTTTVFGIDLVVEIFPIVGSIPGGTVLGSVTVAELSVPTTASFFNVSFSSFGIPVSIGDQLAIVLHDNNNADKNAVYGWVGTSTDLYAGGARFFDIGSRFTSTSTDLFVKTFVAQPALSPESPFLPPLQ